MIRLSVEIRIGTSFGTDYSAENLRIPLILKTPSIY